MRSSVLATLLACACSSSGNGGGGSADAGGSDAGPSVTVTAVDQLPAAFDLRVEAGVQQGLGSTLFKFSNSFVFNATGDCDPKPVGTCIVRTCAGAGSLLDLGPLRVTSTPETWTLVPEPTLHTYVQHNAKSSFAAGTAFQVSARGGADFGAFDLDATMPPAPPDWQTPDASVPIVVGQPVTFTWTAADARLEVGIVQGNFDEPVRTKSAIEIRCHADGKAGAFTVPAEATQALTLTTGARQNYFLGAYEEHLVTYGEKKLTISAFSFVPRLASIQ
jgi:hypothetical protein